MAAAMIVLIVVACSSEKDPKVAVDQDREVTTTAEETTTTTEAPSAPDAAQLYMEALGTGTVDGSAPMRDLSAEGSPARLYGEHFIAIFTAYRSTGSPVYTQTATVQKDGSVTLCDDGLADGIEPCPTYGDFQADASGKLTNFTVNGTAIDGRLLRPSGETVNAQGATLRVLSGYKSIQSDAYFITLEVKAGDAALSVYSFNASYVDPGGAQFSADSLSGISPSDDLQPGASTVVVLAFKGANPGGRLVFPVTNAVSYESSDAKFQA